MGATKISVLAPSSRWTSLKCPDVQMRILNTTVTIGDGVLFFQAGVLFSTENAKLWPVLANYYTYTIAIFWANLRFLAYFLQA